MKITLDKTCGAVSAAEILASANCKARGVWLWRVHYGARDYVGRRGGDLMIDIDPANAAIKQILRGQ